MTHARSASENGKPLLRVLMVEDSVDDELLTYRELSRSFKVTYKRVQTEAAMQLELEQRPWDVVVCDFRMPSFSASRALDVFKTSAHDIPFIVLSGTIEAEGAVEIMVQGADDFVTKDHMPRLSLAVKRQIREKAARLKDTLLLEESYEATIEAWGRALEQRDEHTKGHTLRVTDLAMRLARKVGFSGEDLRNIYRGSLLHDIGKIGMKDAILLKPDGLDDEERKIMQLHPQHAYDLLFPSTFLRPALKIPYCHHEKWDGTGYPRGLQGEDIPLEARVFAVCDVYDALTSDRPYRKSMGKEKALAYIQEESGKYFDPMVVDKFIEMMQKEGLE